MLKSLPSELQLEILSYLSYTDYIHLSRTSRSLSRNVKPLLFSVLNLRGTLQRYYEGHKNSTGKPYDWMSTVSDRSYLDNAVYQVIKLDIATFVKTFSFSPVLFVDEFWSNYKGCIEENANEFYPDDLTSFSDDDYEEQNDEARPERIAKKRQALVQRVYERIKHEERIWQDRISSKQTHFDSSQTAFIQLIQQMPNLKRVEILESRNVELDDAPDEPRHCDLAWEGCWDEIVWSNFELLARSLYSTGQHITTLRINSLHSSKVTDTPAIRHIFNGLVELHLKLEETVDTGLSGSTHALRALQALIKCARPTLRHLSIDFLRKYPPILVPTIFNLFSEPQANGGDELTPWIFPHLHELRLESCLMDGPSFVKFIQAQPALRTIYFKYIYLNTPNWTWANIATALPACVQSWYVDNCEQHPESNNSEPLMFDSTVVFRPYSMPLPPSCGWEAKDPLNEDDPDPDLYSYFRQAMRDRLTGSHSLIWRTSAIEVFEYFKVLLIRAAFVRVEKERMTSS